MISPSLTDLSDALTVMDMRAEWERCERLDGTSCQVAKLQWVEKWARPAILHIESPQDIDADTVESLSLEVTALEEQDAKVRQSVETAILLLDRIDIPAARERIDKAIVTLEEHL